MIVAQPFTSTRRITRAALFTALGARTYPQTAIPLDDGMRVSVSSVEREDGSGSSFNVIAYRADGMRYSVYVRTID